MSIIHGANCSSGTLSSLPKARPRSQGHFRMTDCLLFVRFDCLSDFFHFQRLCHARWHLKPTLATHGCPLRVGPLRGRDDAQTA